MVERLLAKYMKQEYVPVEEHIQNIKLSCSHNRKSKRENKRKLSKMYLKKLCIKNGIPQVTVHGLRHIYASILTEQGVSLSKISALLGHNSIHTTFDIYCDVITAKEGITALINNIFTTEECS